MSVILHSSHNPPIRPASPLKTYSRMHKFLLSYNNPAPFLPFYCPVFFPPPPTPFSPALLPIPSAISFQTHPALQFFSFPAWMLNLPTALHLHHFLFSLTAVVSRVKFTMPKRSLVGLRSDSIMDEWRGVPVRLRVVMSTWVFGGAVLAKRWRMGVDQRA